MGSIINPGEKQTWAITAQGITVMGKTKSYNTYEEMLQSNDPGLINYVTDASGDPTVHSGFAVYRYANGIFTKVYEGEMMDPDLGMAFEWSKIVNGPASTPTDIDAAVEKTQPMEIQKDDTGRVVGLAVNGILLATEEQIAELEGKTAGALHFKGVVENKAALPTEGNVQGDVYVDKAGKEYVYVDGTGFEEFGSITDLTNYYTKDEITSILATYLPLTNGVFSGLVYMEEAATSNAAQNIIVLGSNAIMNRVSIGQQDPTGFDADKLYSFKYFEAGPLGMKGFVDYLKSKGVDDAITSAIRTNGVQIQDTGKKISDIPFYQTFQNSNDDAPRKTIQLANHDTISGITTNGSGVNIAMVSKWDKVDLGSASIQLNLNSSDRPTLNDEDPIVVQSDLADYAKFEPNTSDPSRPDRKVLTLKNDDNICGYTTAGGSVNLAMISKWDVADFGSTSVPLNLNSKAAVTVNDKDIVLTDANYSEFITIPSLEGLATEESVQAQIAQEAEDRQAADSSLTAAIGLKQNALTVDGQKLVLTNDVLELGADVVVMQNPWDPNLPNRRHIVLKNHDSIVGTMTTGDNGTLIMMSKWDKVDVGTTKAQMNLNSPNGVIQVNDEAVVVTSANIGEYAPAADLSNYYTKVEVDQKIAGVLTYKGVLATVEELQSVEAPATGWVYHITATGAEYAYNGSEWEELGSEVDLSAYAKTEDVTAAIEAAKTEVAASVTAEAEARAAADTAMDNRVTGLQSDLSTKVDATGAISAVDNKYGLQLHNQTMRFAKNRVPGMLEVDGETYTPQAGDFVFLNSGTEDDPDPAIPHKFLKNLEIILDGIFKGPDYTAKPNDQALGNIVFHTAPTSALPDGGAVVVNSTNGMLFIDTDEYASPIALVNYLKGLDNAQKLQFIQDHMVITPDGKIADRALNLDLSVYAKTEDVTADLEGKVDKVAGKSLVDDTEIARLASVSNYDDAEVKADIASIKSDYATKTELSEYKVNLGAGTANTFVITNADGTIKASEYKMGGSSIAAEPNATTAATEQAVKTFVTNSVATKADTASFDVPSNIILVSSSVSDNEEGDTVCLDGYLGIVGTNTFATLTEAVAAASAYDTIRIIGGQYIESPTIDKAVKIYGVNNPSFAGRFAFSGDLSGTVLEGVEINYAADANDTISHSVQYSSIGITPTGDLDGFIIRDCRIRTSGMATGIYVVGNDSDVVIENCEVIGGARNDGKTVASIVFQGNTHTAPVVKNCHLYGSVYFNSTTVSATVEGNTFRMVDSSAVSFAKKLSGNIIVRNNEFLSDGVNNAFKFNGSGTVGTNTGVDFTDLESLVIVDNYVAVNESFVYMQAQTTAWDASKVTVENNRLFFRDDAVMFKNEDSSVTYEFSASNVVLNEASVQYDDSELQAAVDAVEKTASKANGNVVSMSDRLAALEAQIVSLKQTDVAAVTSSADLAQADKDLIITIAEPITGTTTVEGKSIEVKQLTTNNATTVFKTEGDVTMKNLTTTGDLPKTTANAQVRIVSGDYVRITDSAINQTGYNAIEIGLGTGSGPSATKSIVIDNVKFNSTLTNNAISIFATEDGSVITISNCTFTKCSNPVRLSNATGGKVTINLVNCEFTEWDSNPDWAGILIMQDYTSGSAEAIQTNNLFGPDKVTINVINCTHAGEKIVAPANIADVCGTKNAATQLFYIWSNEEGFVAYDAERYPVINIQ